MRQITSLKIIGLMRKDMDKGRSILEISKLLKIGYRPAYNHIIEMEKEQIILVEKIGSSKQCRLNLNNPKTRHYLELLDINKKEEICTKNPKLRSILGKLILKIAGENISSILSVILFGSYAKGNATKQSDVDLMFVISNLDDNTLRNIIERECASYQISHNLQISPLITDIKELRKMLASKEFNIGTEIRESGISLYGHEMFWRLIA
jgi:hypothetical protein